MTKWTLLVALSAVFLLGAPTVKVHAGKDCHQINSKSKCRANPKCNWAMRVGLCIRRR